MKFRVQFKDPDALSNAISEAAGKSIPDGLDDDEHEAVREKRIEKLNNLCGKWFCYGEYVVIEIDIESTTAIVLPQV